MSQDRVISVVGLGYVGLPVAVAFGKVRRTIGFDINRTRIKELREGYDRTDEVTSEELSGADILFTDRIEDLKGADFHIVAVPTPIDEANQPDLSLMCLASETVGMALKPRTEFTECFQFFFWEISRVRHGRIHHRTNMAV